ncbi:MAG: hypothetical protein H6Q31_2283 [Bacteroidetes bacterium]|jgi:hypothetical protein|nr:hypothetical protein [Bacteroidota bacterium]
MITDTAAYTSFKRRSLADRDLGLEEKYRILEALYHEARRLGWFTAQDLSLGLEHDVRLAAALNANVSEPPR